MSASVGQFRHLSRSLTNYATNWLRACLSDGRLERLKSARSGRALWRLFITRLLHLLLLSLNHATKIWVRYDYPKFVPSFQGQRCIHQAVFLHVGIQVTTLVIVKLILHSTHAAKLPSSQLGTLDIIESANTSLFDFDNDFCQLRR